MEGGGIDPIAGRRSYDVPSFARNWSERSRSERAPASSPTGGAGIAAVSVEVGIAATEGDGPVEVGDGPGEVPPGGVEASAADPGLGVVRVEPERRVEVGHGTVEVAQSSTGLGPGAVQLGVAGGESGRGR